MQGSLHSILRWQQLAAESTTYKSKEDQGKGIVALVRGRPPHTPCYTPVEGLGWGSRLLLGGSGAVIDSTAICRGTDACQKVTKGLSQLVYRACTHEIQQAWCFLMEDSSAR